MDHGKDYYDGLIDVSLPLQEHDLDSLHMLMLSDHPCIRLRYCLQHLYPRSLEGIVDWSFRHQRQRGYGPPTHHPEQQLLVQHQLSSAIHPLRYRAHLQQLL